MDKLSEHTTEMAYLYFTGSDIVFAPVELAAVLEAALDLRYGAGFQVLIHDVDAGDYSDDVSLQIIAPRGEQNKNMPSREGV